MTPTWFTTAAAVCWLTATLWLRPLIALSTETIWKGLCVCQVAYTKFNLFSNPFQLISKFVRLREYDINSDTDCIIRDEYMLCSEPVIDSIPRNITIHPKYNTSDHNSYHDIALIEIDPISSYSDFLQPICLPEPEMDNGMTVGKKFVVSGWGRTDICEFVWN